MSIWPTEVLWSPLPPDGVADAINADFGVTGSATPDRFKFTLANVNKNSWRPMAAGKLTAAGGGTLIEVRYPMHPFVVVFTLLHGLPFLGLTWVIGLLAYAASLQQVKNALFELVQAVAKGADAYECANAAVSDPTRPGAAAAAPFSLRARHGMDHVTFALGSTSLRVDAAGLTLTGETSAKVSWEELTGALAGEAAGSTLALFTASGNVISLSMVGLPEADQQWLADYINARDAERTASDEDRARARALHGAVNARRTE